MPLFHDPIYLMNCILSKSNNVLNINVVYEKKDVCVCEAHFIRMTLINECFRLNITWKLYLYVKNLPRLSAKKSVGEILIWISVSFYKYNVD